MKIMHMGWKLFLRKREQRLATWWEVKARERRELRGPVGYKKKERRAFFLGGFLTNKAKGDSGEGSQMEEEKHFREEK